MTLKNSEENATITLISTQTAGEDKDRSEFTTSGGYYERDGKRYITYREHSDMGMGNSRVILKVEPDMVTMRRMGDFSTVMRYRKNEITEFAYTVPFGEMNIKIKTLNIRNLLNEDGGELKFSYLLLAGGEALETEISISVRKERD